MNILLFIERGVHVSVKKVSMAVFIVGSLVAIFGGVFPVNDNFKLITLLSLGFLVGLLNISDHQQKDFLIASTAFLFSGWLLTSNVLPSNFYILGNIIDVISNFMIFVIPAVIAISLKMVFAYSSESDKTLAVEMSSPEDRHVMENIWDVVVLAAVAFVFVILILQIPFFELNDTYPGIYSALDSLDLFIVGIFVIDLIVIFRNSKSIREFLLRNWLDILAVLPIVSFLKISRAFKIVKIFSKAEKGVKAGSKVMKINRGAKFFSEESGFNKLLDNSPKKTVKSAKKKKSPKSKSSKKSKK